MAHCCVCVERGVWGGGGVKENNETILLPGLRTSMEGAHGKKREKRRNSY